ARDQSVGRPAEYGQRPPPGSDGCRLGLQPLGPGRGAECRGSPGLAGSPASRPVPALAGGETGPGGSLPGTGSSSARAGRPGPGPDLLRGAAARGTRGTAGIGGIPGTVPA